MLPKPAENKLVSPFFVFYIIHAMQVGVGILGFERYISKVAGEDSWVSIILSGISIHVLVWLSYKILNRGQNDIFVIHRDVLGKWAGGFISFYLICYITIFAIIILRSYVEVIQVWMFPDLHAWYLTMILLVLVYYAVIGGFRVIVGLCFLGVIYSLPLLLLKAFPLKEAHFSNLLPIFDHSVLDLIKGGKIMTFNFLGFETLFFFYPFIKKPESSHKWAQLGVLSTTLIYVITALVSFVYFSQEQLFHTVWPTLSLWQTVNLPFIQRFEYAGLSIWLFVVLPNICLMTWAASRGIKQMTSIKQKHSLVFILLITFIACTILSDRGEIDMISTWINRLGFYTIYFYIPFLFFFQKFRDRPGQTT
ncbi:GerAB/ArcD/ProY family transporter [Peribacillus sp. SCS-37]|uniref:GerAB/ArcD/ProY family transporter n=1 Tax=Paraperibacillus esterisolvens TaxID=3115296 RepID=UPI0039063D31